MYGPPGWTDAAWSLLEHGAEPAPHGSLTTFAGIAHTTMVAAVEAVELTETARRELHLTAVFDVDRAVASERLADALWAGKRVSSNRHDERLEALWIRFPDGDDRDLLAGTLAELGYDVTLEHDGEQWWIIGSAAEQR